MPRCGNSVMPKYGHYSTADAFFQRYRKNVNCQTELELDDFDNPGNLLSEVYHQARRAGLFMAVRPKIWLNGYDKLFMPSLAFMSLTREVYCFARIGRISKKYGNFIRGQASRRMYNDTGLPWFELKDGTRIPEAVKFAVNSQYLTNIGAVRDWNNSESIAPVGNSEHHAAKRAAKGASTSVCKGAFVPPTRFGGFGKLR